MTQLARNNLRMEWKEAGRNFVAKCGHKIKKGDKYLALDDYFAYTKYHMTKCEKCANGTGAKA